MMKNQIAFTMSIILLAILFVILAILAGWLFSIGGMRDPERPGEPAPHVAGLATGEMEIALAPDESVLLREEEFVADHAPRKEPILTATNTIFGGGAFGELPMLCPQTGLEIRQQRYYPSPVLHDALVSPSLVRFDLGESIHIDNLVQEDARP
jgi:hypothetical protein